MLTLPGPPWDPLIAPRLAAALAWPAPDQASLGGARVWPLRPAWMSIVLAALALGPVTVRAGDGLCRIAQRGRLRWLMTPGDGADAAGADGLDIDTQHWACGVATLAPPTDGRPRCGFAFFDDQGQAVLRLELGAGASLDGFCHLVGRYAQAAPSDAATSCGKPAQAAIPPSHGPLPAGGSPRSRPADTGIAAVLRPLVNDALAAPLSCDAVLEVLRHACQSDLVMRSTFFCRGLRLAWTGALHHLTGSDGLASASGAGLQIEWREARPGPQAWLLREPTAAGLLQSLALLAPNGELRLLLRPAQGRSRPQPCAWQSALDAASGGRCGSAC